MEPGVVGEKGKDGTTVSMKFIVMSDNERQGNHVGGACRRVTCRSCSMDGIGFFSLVEGRYKPGNEFSELLTT